MQWTTPLWAETAGTSHSEDEEVSTSSAPLTKTYGGDGKRLYDQVILRAAAEAQTSARPTNRPTKKETECARHTKTEGVGLESPLGYKTPREARYHHPPARQVDDLTQRRRRLTTQRPGAPSDIACLRGALLVEAADRRQSKNSRELLPEFLWEEWSTRRGLTGRGEHSVS